MRMIWKLFCPHDNAETVENAHISMPGQQVVVMRNQSVTSNTTEEHCACAYWASSWASGCRKQDKNGELLRVTLGYKVSRCQEKIQWELCQIK